MNLPIYNTRMAELQSVWHPGLGWSCSVQCTVEIVCQGLFDADTSFGHADKYSGFVKNQSQ